MTKAQKHLVSAALVLASILPAAAEEGNGNPGTVNYFTPSQKALAFRAARAAGFNPAAVAAFQDGNFFIKAEKAGEHYQLTVVPSGKVYASAPERSGM